MNHDDALALLREISEWLTCPDCRPETIEHIKARIDAFLGGGVIMVRYKEQRWYEVEDGKLHIYNQPIKSAATACSMVSLSDFGYYRSNFELRKVWC